MNCKKGYKEKNGKCSKKRQFGNRNNSKNKININWAGVIFIILAGLIYWFRPLQNCAWWNIFCNLGTTVLTPIFLLVSLVLFLVGIIKLFKGNK
jgi:hypothetical protein